jgi:hypothetical protein
MFMVGSFERYCEDWTADFEINVCMHPESTMITTLLLTFK